MRQKGKVVYFNTSVYQIGNLNFYITVILHEAYHLFAQRLPNKEDATQVKDDFTNELMKLIDIQADLHVAWYFQKKWGMSFEEYLKILHSGSTIFKDKDVREN